MHKKKSIQKWKDYFEDRGLSPEVISEYTPYIQKLNRSNVPVVFEREHLSLLLGIQQSDIFAMINSPLNFYRSFSIPKRKGGQRDILSPYPSLLYCQRWIYENILLNKKVHSCAHGFVPKRSIVSNAKPHLNKKALLKMDLTDFFPSISINWVVNYFNQLGYSNSLAYCLASLCCMEGHLPQGACTSPYLSNLLLIGLDRRLHKLSISYGLTYTRYADDMTFSGGYIPHRFIGIVSGIVAAYGLCVNEGKTRLHTKLGQRIVTGISVAGTELRVPKRLKRELRQDLFYIKQYGFISHISKLKIKDPYYVDSLYGKFSFWSQVEPNNPFPRESMEFLKSARNY